MRAEIKDYGETFGVNLLPDNIIEVQELLQITT